MVAISEINSMFWGVTLDGGKRYSQVVENSFHISMAALEPAKKDIPKEEKLVSVMIQHEKSEFLLCTLEFGKVYQQPLDLNFTEGEEVTFFLSGKGVVHLSGFLVEDDRFDNDIPDHMLVASEEEMTESEEEESSDDEDEDVVPTLQAITADDDDDDSEEDEDYVPVKSKDGKRKKNGGLSKKDVKKLKLQRAMDEDSDDESEEEDDEEDMSWMDSSARAFLDYEEGDSDDDDDDDNYEFDEDGDIDFDEEESEEEEKPVKKQQKTPKSEKKQKADAAQKTPKSEAAGKTPKSEKKGKPATPKSTKKDEKKEPTTPAANNVTETPSSKKKKKKKKNKKKGEGEETPQAQQNKTPSQTPQQSKKPVKRTLQGGTVVEDLKEGHGPEAKHGKQVAMYYVGKLQQNGKEFDSTRPGQKPFKFKLGKNEVIKGWDVGIQGMKVGGKRRLTIPPGMGYGKQSQGPIPANSTLVFEVELNNVS